jgi:hypothetical protein
MKRFCKGVQAVTVELFGILMVMGMLFGFTAMGLHSVNGQPPTLGLEITRQLHAWKDQLSNRLSGPIAANPARERYVANRLAFYSQSYKQAARQHVHEVLLPR